MHLYLKGARVEVEYIPVNSTSYLVNTRFELQLYFPLYMIRQIDPIDGDYSGLAAFREELRAYLKTSRTTMEGLIVARSSRRIIVKYKTKEVEQRIIEGLIEQIKEKFKVLKETYNVQDNNSVVYPSFELDKHNFKDRSPYYRGGRFFHI